jgi:hypothetical protein
VNKLGESGASGLQTDSHGKGGVKSAALAAAQACSKAQVEACMKVRPQSVNQSLYIYVYKEDYYMKRMRQLDGIEGHESRNGRSAVGVRKSHRS